MEQELNVKIAKFGLKIIEVPHNHLARTSGESKVNDVRQGVKDLLVVVLDGLRHFENSVIRDQIITKSRILMCLSSKKISIVVTSYSLARFWRCQGSYDERSRSNVF